MHVSDALSRAPLPTQSPSSDDWEEQVLIINSLPVSEEKLAEFREATQKDVALRVLERVCERGVAAGQK